MKIPLKYNIRSLWVRKVGTLMTAVGVGLTVAILVAMMALVTGLEATFAETGQEDQLIVIRKGSDSEINSYFSRELYPPIRLLPELARDAQNEPWAVGEIVVVINHERWDGETSNIIMRGTSERGIQMRREIEMVEGRGFRKGVRELVVSRSLSRRFKDMSLGDTILIAGNQWKVVGIFDASGTAYNSEIWGDYDEIALVWKRPVYASILVRADSVGSVEKIQEGIDEDRRIQLQAVPQKEYYAAQTGPSVGLNALGFFIAVVMGVGSIFAAMNMMYGTIMARFKEVGALRALGFKRRSILASFLMESIFLALLGGVIGCLLALPVNGISTGTLNFTSFAEVLFNFRVTPGILLTAMVFAGFIGIVGGFLPALRAARLQLIEVLRD